MDIVGLTLLIVGGVVFIGGLIVTAIQKHKQL